MRKSKTKEMTIIALLCAIGLIVHQLMPAFFGMQADFTLIMLGIIIIMYNDDFSLCVMAGLILGIFTSMTTKFPGGQIPNILDKTFTSVIIYYVFSYVLKNINNKMIRNTCVFVLTTLVSGFLFLGTAYLLVGLPGSFFLLFGTSILPAILVNTVMGIIIEPIIEKTKNKI